MCLFTINESSITIKNNRLDRQLKKMGHIYPKVKRLENFLTHLSPFLDKKICISILRLGRGQMVKNDSHWICIPNRHKEMTPFFFLCFSRFSVERQSSYPYITGDTWRFFCNWRLTVDETFDPQQIQKGDTIFVEYQLLKKFQ